MPRGAVRKSDDGVRMERQGRLGSIIYSMGIMGLGLVSLLRLDAVPDLEPLPAWLPARTVVAILVAMLLVGGAVAIIINKRAARATLTVATVLSAWLLLLHWPKVVMHPKNGGAWVVLWEVAAISVAAWMLALFALEREGSKPPRYAAPTLRIVLGLALVAFGISHFVYTGYVEIVIPAWIPAHRFFAYATGAAHIAAGCSLLVRVQDQLATALLAVMFGSWVVVLHIPRALANPSHPNEWTSLLVAVCMCGTSLIARAFLRADAARATEGFPSPLANGVATRTLAEPWRSR
ncbi:MAG: hypothetical protein ABJE47_10745 [bacterium]